MSAGEPVPYAVAYVVASALVYHLEPYAAKVAIAGSVRRKKKFVRDVEIVILPAVVHEEKNLFGEVERVHYHDPQKGIDDYNAIERYPLRLRDVEGKDGLIRQLDGDRFKALEDDKTGIPIDLFVVRPPATWGCIFFIRTGPADWNKRAMKRAHQVGLQFDSGQLIRQSTREPLVTDTEEEVFKALKANYRPPSARS